MSNEQTTLRLARWLRGCKLPYDPQDVSDCADELERLATVEIEYGHLLAKVADLTLSLGASDRRVENHTRLIKGYQTELAPLRSELEAARGKVEALTTAARNVVSYRPSMSYNDSYFGEPAGVFKQRVAELDRALSPTSAPMRADCESQNVRDADDMPTEMAVLKREWKAMRLELSMRHSSPPTSA